MLYNEVLLTYLSGYSHASSLRVRVRVRVRVRLTYLSGYSHASSLGLLTCGSKTIGTHSTSSGRRKASCSRQ